MLEGSSDVDLVAVKLLKRHQLAEGVVAGSSNAHGAVSRELGAIAVNGTAGTATASGNTLFVRALAAGASAVVVVRTAEATQITGFAATLGITETARTVRIVAFLAVQALSTTA